MQAAACLRWGLAAGAAAKGALVLMAVCQGGTHLQRETECAEAQSSINVAQRPPARGGEAAAPFDAWHGSAAQNRCRQNSTFKVQSGSESCAKSAKLIF